MKLFALSSDECQELTELIRLTIHYSARLNALALKCNAKSREAISLRFARSRISDCGKEIQAVLAHDPKKE